MHLKTLTLRGFKSFAGSTTLALEPGLTCVVGPNGSGKSNVVDAIAWVLGEQGAKALRGGKMEDVIFAGSPGRPPLGRAEVQLTIDNSDAALPIEYTEVTIGRLMYRSGESEYTINGTSCPAAARRAGAAVRQRHRPRDARHRRSGLARRRPGCPSRRTGGVSSRRRRVSSSTASARNAPSASSTPPRPVSNGLKTWPPSSAANSAPSAGRPRRRARPVWCVAAALRDARLRLLADDVVTAGKALAERGESDTALHRRLAEGEEQLAAAQQADETLSSAVVAGTTRAEQTSSTWHALGRLAERLAAVQALAQQRASYLGAPEPVQHGRDPDQLDAEAASAQRDQQALAAQSADALHRLEAAPRRTGRAAEAALTGYDERQRAAARAAAAPP